MYLSIKTDDLKTKRIFVATPMYGSKCHGEYLKSSIAFFKMCSDLGVQTAFSTLCNESLIARGRNYLVDEFLRSGFTHLMFIDADISFEPQEVLALLIMNKDVVGGYYPDKKINWDNIVNTKKNFVIENDNDLYKFGWDHDKLKSFNDLEEVSVIKPGFMMVKRDVFLKMKLSYPEYFYKPDHVGHANFDGSRNIQLYFSTEIDKTTGKLLSEYEFFCKLWRDLGGSIFLCPWLKLNHYGTLHYSCNNGNLA